MTTSHLILSALFVLVAFIVGRVSGRRDERIKWLDRMAEQNRAAIVAQSLALFAGVPVGGLPYYVWQLQVWDAETRMTPFVLQPPLLIGK